MGRAPSPAERARTALRLSPSLRLRTASACGEIGLHGVQPDGSVVLVVAEDDPVVVAVRRAGDDVPAVVDATDLCPVPVADRVRARVRLAGWLHEPPAALRRELALAAVDHDEPGAVLDIGSGSTVLVLEVAEVFFAPGATDLDEVAYDVDPDDYAVAEPDPLADDEATLLGHLVADHPAELLQLAGLLPPRLLADAVRVVPVAIDRHGLVLRTSGVHGHTDVRLPFRVPVGCPRELPARMTELLTAGVGVPATGA